MCSRVQSGSPVKAYDTTPRNRISIVDIGSHWARKWMTQPPPWSTNSTSMFFAVRGSVQRTRFDTFSAGRRCNGARPVRRRIDVLPRDQAIPKREHIDAVPLELLTFALDGERPLTDREVVPRPKTTGAERH